MAPARGPRRPCRPHHRPAAQLSRRARRRSQSPDAPAKFEQVVHDFIQRLKTSPEIDGRAERSQARPAGPPGRRRAWSHRCGTGHGARQNVSRRPGRTPRSSRSKPRCTPRPSRWTQSDALQMELDGFIVSSVTSAFEQNRQEVADVIADTVRDWDPVVAARPIELAVGRDLQFIRLQRHAGRRNGRLGDLHHVQTDLGCLHDEHRSPHHCARLLVSASASGSRPSGSTPPYLPRPTGARFSHDLNDASRLADDSMRGRRLGTPRTPRRATSSPPGLTRSVSALAGGKPDPAFLGAGPAIPPPTRAAQCARSRSRGRDARANTSSLTAHFDHLGVGRPVDGDSIYNGADDNASGAAALLALAAWFMRAPARHSLLFAAMDGEEEGDLGSTAFVA